MALDSVTRSRAERMMTQTLCVLALLVSTLNAGADTVHIVTGTYPPFAFEQDGQQKGLAVEIVREAFARMGDEVRIEFLPFARAIAIFKAGQADAIFPFSIDADRLTYTLYPKEHLIADTPTLFVKKGSGIGFSGNLKDLAEYSFGMQRSASSGSVFAEAVKSGVITKMEDSLDQEQNIKKLMLNRIQVIIGPRLVIRYEFQKLGLGKDIQELSPAVDKPLAAYLGFSKLRNRKDLLARFDKALHAMKVDKTYEKISLRYE